MASRRYERKGYVSVFVGTMSSRAALDEYIAEDYDDDGNCTCRMWSELGIEWFDHDLQEAEFELPGPVEPTLFFRRPFSYIETFHSELLQACQRIGTGSINMAICMYDFDYSDAGQLPKAMHLAGVFRYSVSHPDWMKSLLR